MRNIQFVAGPPPRASEEWGISSTRAPSTSPSTMDDEMSSRLAIIVLVAATLANEPSGLYIVLTAQAPQEPEPNSRGPQSDARNKIRVTSNLVILPVTVKDAAGNLVPGLQKSDFRISDDGVEQSISVFTEESFPLSLVVLVDDDLQAGVAEQMVKSLRAIVGGFGPEDEAMVCRFDLMFYPGSSFARDPDALWKDLNDARAHSGPSTSPPVPFVTPPSSHPLGVGEPPVAAPTNLGHTPAKALDDAVHAAAQLLHDRGSDRHKIVLLISDGENGKQFNHYTYNDTLGALLRENVSLFGLAVGSFTYKKRFSRLANYANDSGGDIYYAAKSDSMEKLYSRITEQARHEYTLAYVPAGNNKKSDYHSVEVQVTRLGLTAKTRPGYRTSSGNLSQDR